MNNRRLAGLVLLLAVLGMAFPTTGHALTPSDLGGDVEPGLFARFFEWVRVVVFEVTDVFVTQEGATVSPGG